MLKTIKVYVFGNQDLKNDNIAIKIAKELYGKIENINFVFVKPNEDLPFINEENVIIMDVVEKINDVRIITNSDFNKIILSPRTTAHDFDLGFQLRYLKKIGKLGEITIIGLPQKGKVDYLRIQSILRKLVAQDMQGS
jgi:Ni,Fe-hydrogenase maturation factor